THAGSATGTPQNALGPPPTKVGQGFGQPSITSMWSVVAWPAVARRTKKVVCVAGLGSAIVPGAVMGGGPANSSTSALSSRVKRPDVRRFVAEPGFVAAVSVTRKRLSPLARAATPTLGRGAQPMVVLVGVAVVAAGGVAVAVGVRVAVAVAVAVRVAVGVAV